ncbi:hypothetical protein [Helicobacter equorum]|nr:hypothetical protein [Helicobacter equorum]
MGSFEEIQGLVNTKLHASNGLVRSILSLIFLVAELGGGIAH